MQLTIVISAEVPNEGEAATVVAAVKASVDNFKTNNVTVNSQTSNVQPVHKVK